MGSVFCAFMASVLCIWTGMAIAQNALLNMFEKTSTCNAGYGTVYDVKYVRSVTECAVECTGQPYCVSSLYNGQLKRCEFNNETWPNPNTTGCTLDRVYLRKLLLKPVCYPGKGCTNPLHNMRLCDGGGVGICDPKQGRVEVLYNDTWGTVCDDYWADYEYYYDYYTHPGQANAQVICRMLGYKNGSTHLGAYYEPGTGTIWLDDIICVGNETSMYDCPSLPWGEHNCVHSEDAGLTCV